MLLLHTLNQYVLLLHTLNQYVLLSHGREHPDSDGENIQILMESKQSHERKHPDSDIFLIVLINE